jgi:MFS family permease
MLEVDKKLAKSFLLKYYIFSSLQGMYFVGSCLMIIISASGFSPVQISIAVSMYYVIQVIFGIPTGAIADRFGSKNTLVIAKVLSLLGYYFLYLRRDFNDIIFCYALWGMAGTLISGAQESLIYDNLKHHRIHKNYAKYDGTSSGIVLISFSFSALVSSYLIKFGFNIVIIATMISWLLQIILLIIIKDEKRHNKNLAKLSSNYLKTLKSGLKYAFKNRVICKFMLFFAFLNSTIGIFDQYYDLFLFHITDNIVFVPILISLEYTLQGIFKFLFTRKFQNRSLVFCIVSSLIGSLVCLVGFIEYDFPFAYVASIVFWVIIGTMYSIINARNQFLIPSKIRATVISVSNFVFGIFGIISLLLFGFIAKVFSYKIGFISMSIFQISILLIFIFILGVDRHIKKRERVILPKFNINDDTPTKNIKY